MFPKIKQALFEVDSIFSIAYSLIIGSVLLNKTTRMSKLHQTDL